MEEALFVIPANLTRPFFVRLYAECEAEIFKHFGEQIRPIIRSINHQDEEFNPEEVRRIIEREFRMSRQSIKYLIVVPTESKELSKGIAVFAAQHKLPVISLTLPFRRWPRRFSGSQEVHRPPPCIYCSSFSHTKELGAVAAKYLEKSAVARSVDVLLMMGSRFRMDSRRRVSGFRKGFEQSRPKDVNDRFIEDLEPGRWLRRKAYDIFKQLIERRMNSAEPDKPVDVIFAANDEMALGIRDAIIELSGNSATSHLVSNSILFGFDAVAEAQALIHHEAELHFRGTVEQQTHQIARQLVVMIEKIRSGEAIGDVEVEAKTILNHKHVAPAILSTEYMIETFPRNIPSLDEINWIAEKELASRPKLSIKSLKRYRRRSAVKKVTDDLMCGVDKTGRIYRVDRNQRVWYLRMSLHKKRRTKRASANLKNQGADI